MSIAEPNIREVVVGETPGSVPMEVKSIWHEATSWLSQAWSWRRPLSRGGRQYSLKDLPECHGEAEVLEMVRREVGSIHCDHPDKLVTAALKLQYLHEEQDLLWLGDLGIQEDLASVILLRLGQRGGCWLEFVETAAQFRGSLADLPVGK